MPGDMFSDLRNGDVHSLRRLLYDEISAAGTLQTHARKSVIFSQGADVDAVYAVKGGLVETTGLNQSGREVTLSIRGPGESFGYSEAILGRPRTRQAIALLDAELWRIDAQAFLKLTAEKPVIILAMLGSALDRVTQSSEMRADLRGTSAKARVGYVLSRLATGTEALKAAKTPELQITHEEVSRICDISRQTVTTILGNLKRDGIVDLGLRSVRILDRDRLYDLDEDD